MQLEIQIYQDNDLLDSGWELIGTVRSQDNGECTLHAGATGRLGALLTELNRYGVRDWVALEPLSYDAGNFYIASLAWFYTRNRRAAIMVLNGKEISIAEVIDLVYPDWENRQNKELENINVKRQGTRNGATGSASEGTAKES